MTNEEKDELIERQKFLKICFKNLLIQLKKYQEGSPEYNLILDDLSKISIELLFILKSLTSGRNYFKIFAERVILGTSEYEMPSKKLSRKKLLLSFNFL